MPIYGYNINIYNLLIVRIEISDTLQWIKSKLKFPFKNLVKAKARELTLELNKMELKMKKKMYNADS